MVMFMIKTVLLATKQQGPEVPRAVAASIDQRANSPRDVSSTLKREGRNRRIRDPYVRWCGRTAEANPSASYPIIHPASEEIIERENGEETVREVPA
jgi:hypothetical protein